MIDALEFLICRGARFERGRDPSVITLVFSDESIPFDEQVRKRFRAILLPFSSAWSFTLLQWNPKRFLAFTDFGATSALGNLWSFHNRSDDTKS
jgi:hypothetical protein